MTATTRAALFASPIGDFGLAWRGAAFVGARLPEADRAAAERRLLARFSAEAAAPPAFVREAAAAIVALLRGERVALDAVALDWSGVEPFDRRVLEATRAIPAGRTTTYGAIARAIGAPEAARAVGAALGRNPFPILVPCHRVLAAGGKPGGFSAPGGATTKLRLLMIENAGIGEGPSLFD